MNRDVTAVLSDSLPMVAVKRRMSRAVAVSRRLLLIVGLLVGVIAALFICVAGSASNVLFNHVRDAYVLYRVTHERDALRASLQQIENEVAVLRFERSKDKAIDDQLQAKLHALRDVVALAGSLGLVDKAVTANGGTDVGSKEALAAAQQGSGELRQLARMLAGSATTGAAKSSMHPDRVQKLRAMNKGLGGAEVECKRAKHGGVTCISDETKLDVAQTSRGADSMLGQVSGASAAVAHSVHSRTEALDLITGVTKALRVMPIGSPVEGDFISGFGHRRSPFSRRFSFHEGVDISLPHGGKVLSTADGVVAKVGYDHTYGWMVDIAHAPHLVTRYAHLSRSLVREGDHVRRGDRIALSGSSGRSTGPHLHYEVRLHGVARDPKPFLAIAIRLRTFS
jgi:murein DD-endopeptidase MepM/ murein hydrolase activator NlpD